MKTTYDFEAITAGLKTLKKYEGAVLNKTGIRVPIALTGRKNGPWLEMANGRVVNIESPRFYGTIQLRKGTEYYRAGIKMSKMSYEAAKASYAKERAAKKAAQKTEKKTKTVVTTTVADTKDFDALSIEVFSLLQKGGYMSNPVTLGLFTDACARKDASALGRVKAALAV